MVRPMVGTLRARCCSALQHGAGGFHGVPHAHGQRKTPARQCLAGVWLSSILSGRQSGPACSAAADGAWRAAGLRAGRACGPACGRGARLPLPRGRASRTLLVVATQLHLAEDPLALHLLLERLEGLIDVVVADENLHVFASSSCCAERASLKFGSKALSHRLQRRGPISRRSASISGGRLLVHLCRADSHHALKTMVGGGRRRARRPNRKRRPKAPSVSSGICRLLSPKILPATSPVRGLRWGAELLCSGGFPPSSGFRGLGPAGARGPRPWLPQGGFRRHRRGLGFGHGRGRRAGRGLFAHRRATTGAGAATTSARRRGRWPARREHGIRRESAERRLGSAAARRRSPRLLPKPPRFPRKSPGPGSSVHGRRSIGGVTLGRIALGSVLLTTLTGGGVTVAPVAAAATAATAAAAAVRILSLSERSSPSPRPRHPLLRWRPRRPRRLGAHVIGRGGVIGAGFALSPRRRRRRRRRLRGWSSPRSSRRIRFASVSPSASASAVSSDPPRRPRTPHPAGSNRGAPRC